MGIEYLLDTNIPIYYLQDYFTLNASLFIDDLLFNTKTSISIITEIELLCWRTQNQKDVVILNSFISDQIVFGIDNEIKIKTIEIRRNYRIKLPDALIAATALVNNITLLTNNTKDFLKIENLKLMNPLTIE